MISGGNKFIVPVVRQLITVITLSTLFGVTIVEDGIEF